MSEYPLLHPGLTPAQDWSDQGVSLDSDKRVSTPPSWSDHCIGLVGPGGISGLRQVGVHSSILVQQLVSLLGGPGACLDSDKWVSTPPSWSDSLHHYWSDQGHVWTWMSGYPLLHPGLMACTPTRWTRGMS